MTDLDPADIDLPTLAALAGTAATEFLLDRLRRAGTGGITISHGYILQRLLAGEPTIGELADALGVTQQAVSKSVGELEALGIAERRPDPHDARLRRVALTEHGRKVVDAGRAERRDLHARLTATVGPDDVDAARRALTALIDLTVGTERLRHRRMRPPSAS